jgi:co-chaperonin GroES (HSP10)
MKIQPPDGFVNIVVLDKFKRSTKSNLFIPTWQAFQKVLIGKVVGVGNPGIGYDNKYYDTSEVKEDDYVIFVPFDSVIYQYLDEVTGEIIEIYKTPISSVLAVLENYEE